MSDPTFSEQVSAAVALALRTKGMTQTELARLAQQSLKHVNEVLRGRSGVDPQTLDLWAEVLGARWRVTLVETDDELNQSAGRGPGVEPGSRPLSPSGRAPVAPNKPTATDRAALTIPADAAITVIGLNVKGHREHDDE